MRTTSVYSYPFLALVSLKRTLTILITDACSHVSGVRCVPSALLLFPRWSSCDLCMASGTLETNTVYFSPGNSSFNTHRTPLLICCEAEAPCPKPVPIRFPRSLPGDCITGCCFCPCCYQYPPHSCSLWLSEATEPILPGPLVAAFVLLCPQDQPVSEKICSQTPASTPAHLGTMLCSSYC